MLQEPVTEVTAVTETSILPGLGMADLRPDLIARARDAGDGDVSDEEFLIRAGLARRDARTGETGILLPALLLFGRDEALRGALPNHGTLAWFRDARRRLTREEIRTNLLDTFDRLMAFAARHLPEGASESAGGEGVPANLRDLVLAEIFINSLLHRDYTKPFPAAFGIEPGRVFLENGSIGASPAKPKNPVLARAFARLGWTRGPGIASPLARWGRAYFGMEPMTFEGSTYRLVAAYPPQGAADMQVEPRKPPQRVNTLQSDAARTAAAAVPPVPKIRPTIRELEALLSEALPAFPPPLQDLPEAPARVETQAAPARPAFAVHWEEAGPAKPAPSAPLPRSDAPSSPPRTLPTPSMPSALSTPSKPSTPSAPSTPAPAKTAPVREPVAPAPFPSGPAPRAPQAPSAAASASVGERTERILKFCETPRHRAEIQEFAGFQNRDYFRKEILNPLIEQGLLAPTLPDKPNSPNQQYRTVRS